MGLHSISDRGMGIFAKRIEALIGGIEVDLVSAPIEPGEHRLEIETSVGGIEIYLPKYVKYTLEGGAVIGGQDVHVGFPWWSRLGRRIAKMAFMPSRIPNEAVPNPSPDQPITIHLVIEGGIGGVDIYRL